MSLNSSALDAFVMCARLQSFTKAAAELHITQSALSQRIRNLEEDLGKTILIRERSGIRVTEFGEKLLRYCQGREAAEAELLGDVPEHLRIGAFSTVARSLVIPALAPLLTKNPRLNLKFMVREVYELFPLLRAGEVDFLLTTDDQKRHGIVSEVIGHEENVLIQKKGYRGREIYLDHDEADTTTASYLKKKVGEFDRHYLDDIYGIIDGVRKGLGKAVVPLHLISEMKDIEILSPAKKLRVPIVLCYYEQVVYPKFHRDAVDLLRKLR